MPQNNNNIFRRHFIEGRAPERRHPLSTETREAAKLVLDRIASDGNNYKPLQFDSEDEDEDEILLIKS